MRSKLAHFGQLCTARTHEPGSVQMSEARVRARSSLRCLDRPYRLVGVRRLVGVAVGVH